MTSILTRGMDHFEPESALSPQEQRKLKGYLEQIDFAAFAANREILGASLKQADLKMFERLAVASAHARAHWLKAAVAMSEGGHPPSPERTAQLTSLHQAYNELTTAYEGLRRLVERGYLPFKSAT